jgi:TM2 domain-containing membrane protein YozV
MTWDGSDRRSGSDRRASQQFKQTTTGIESVLLIVASLGTVAFGADRIMNHDLIIGGAFFLLVGIMCLILSLFNVILMFLAYRKKK